MVYAQARITEIAAKLTQLGLTACQVCGSETALRADHRPVVVSIGGVAWPNHEGKVLKEPSTNVLFMVRVECEVCGHSLMFNSEKFFSGDTPILEAG
jgi:hypothetical protein